MRPAWLGDGPPPAAHPTGTAHFISPRPLDLGPKFLNGLVQASVAAQLRLHTGQVHTPLGTVHPALVLFHPGQQVVQVAQSGVLKFGAPLRALRALRHLGHLGHGGRDTCLQPEVVLSADGHQALVQAVHPGGSGESSGGE